MKRTTPNYLPQDAFPEPKRRTIVEVQTNPCFKKGAHQAMIWNRQTFNFLQAFS